jgi:hypothetical protein
VINTAHPDFSTMSTEEEMAKAWYATFAAGYCGAQQTQEDCLRHNAYLPRSSTWSIPDILDSCPEKVDLFVGPGSSFNSNLRYNRQLSPTRHICKWTGSACEKYDDPPPSKPADVTNAYYEIRSFYDDQQVYELDRDYIYPECTHFEPERCPFQYGCTEEQDSQYGATELSCPGPAPPPLPPNANSRDYGFHSNARAFYQGPFSRPGQSLSTRASFIVKQYSNVYRVQDCMGKVQDHATTDVNNEIIEFSEHRLAVDNQLSGSGVGTLIKMENAVTEGNENPYAYTVHGCRYHCKLARCQVFELKRNEDTGPVGIGSNPRECHCATFDSNSAQQYDLVGESIPNDDDNRVTGSPSSLPVNSFALDDDNNCYLLYTEVGNVDYTSNPVNGAALADDPLANSNVDLKLAWGCDGCAPAHEMKLLQYDPDRILAGDSQPACSEATAWNSATFVSPQEITISIGKIWNASVARGDHFGAYYDSQNSGVGWVIPSRVKAPTHNYEHDLTCSAEEAAWEPLTLLQCMILAQHRRDFNQLSIPVHSSVTTLNDDAEATTQDALGVCKFQDSIGWYFDALDHTNGAKETGIFNGESVTVSQALAAVADECGSGSVACACIRQAPQHADTRGLLQEFFVSWSPSSSRMRMERARQLELESQPDGAPADFDAEAFKNGFAAAASVSPDIVTVTVSFESDAELRVVVRVRPTGGDFFSVRKRMNALARTDQRAKLVDLTGAAITRVALPYAKRIVAPPPQPPPSPPSPTPPTPPPRAPPPLPGIPPLAPPLPLPYFAIHGGETCESASTPGSALREPTLAECREIAAQSADVFEVYNHPTGELHEESGCLEWKTHDLDAVEYIINDETHPCPDSDDVTCYCVHV